MDKSLTKLLDEFEPETSEEKGVTLSIWVPLSYKDAYDEIQESSNRKFSKKLSKLLQAAIDASKPKSA